LLSRKEENTHKTIDSRGKTWHYCWCGDIHETADRTAWQRDLSAFSAYLVVKLLHLHADQAAVTYSLQHRWNFAKHGFQRYGLWFRHIRFAMINGSAWIRQSFVSEWHHI
jgi:hypothetical protein